MTVNSCSQGKNVQQRRLYIHKKKLEMLRFFKDSLERRISAVNASISTLETQIDRDSEQIENI
tara:strand:- start:1864 stop:2052 length:189 start_codon:yes stop_codon:yes gene_type:complete